MFECAQDCEEPDRQSKRVLENRGKHAKKSWEFIMMGWRNRCCQNLTTVENRNHQALSKNNSATLLNGAVKIE
jgi:hypothetical protein